jgi:signal recognition particle subunit SRP54
VSKWDFNDFLGQIRAVKRIGPLTKLLATIPGMSSMQVSGDEPDPFERMIEAMTPGERAAPALIQEGDEAAARRSRIARDSDVTSEEVAALVRQFHAMKRMVARLRTHPFGKDDPPSGDRLN